VLFRSIAISRTIERKIINKYIIFNSISKKKEKSFIYETNNN